MTTISTLKELNETLKKIPRRNLKDQMNSIRELFCYLSPVPIKHNTIELRASSIHGKGVFATEDIPKDTIITYYPAHAITENGKFIPNDKDPDFIKNREEICRHYGQYISLPENIELIGNPNNTSNHLLLGHMINDPVGNVYKNVNFEDTKDLTKYKNLVAEYYIQGSKKRNSKIVFDEKNIVAAVISTKEIKKDEEILMYYEPQYWFNINYGTSNVIGNHGLINLMMLMRDKDFGKWLIEIT